MKTRDILTLLNPTTFSSKQVLAIIARLSYVIVENPTMLQSRY